MVTSGDGMVMGGNGIVTSGNGMATSGNGMVTSGNRMVTNGDKWIRFRGPDQCDPLNRPRGTAARSGTDLRSPRNCDSSRTAGRKRAGLPNLPGGSKPLSP